MARLFVTSINLNKNELQNARIQNLSSAPSTPVSGQIYYDTSTNILYFYNGTSWIPASGSAEVIQDEINNTLQAGEGIDLTYNDGAGTLTIDAEVATHANLGVASFNDTDFTVTAGAVTLNAERVEDIVGGMVSTNTETLISVSYDDTNGKLNFAATDQFAASTTSNLAEGTNLYYTAERVQDEISTAIVAGTGLDSTYNDGAGTLTLDIDSTVTTNSGTQTLTNKTLGASTTLGANLDAGTYTAGAGLTLNGTVFSADVTPTSGNPSLINTGGAIEVKTDTTRGLSVDANGLGVNAGTGLAFSSGALTFASGYGVRKYSTDLGDAAATSYTVTHSLGTKDVTVHIYENGSPYSQIEADVEHTTNNTVTVKFATAPSSNQYRVVIVG